MTTRDRSKYDSLTTMEADPGTPACTEIWAPIHALAEPGSFHDSIWTDPQRGPWFER